MRRPSLQAVVTAAVVVGAAVFILLQLQPGLIAAATTPAGGDMGAHVWGPAFLRDHLLPHGRITGWTQDWYDGFPAYHYYFPLPSLLIVLLDVVLPYGVAFKVVTVAGLIALPFAATALGKALRLPFPTPALMAAATIPYVFDRFHTIWGGNAAATLAGEFAFSIGLAIALFFLAALARALETGRGRALAAALLAATALCHLLPAVLAVVGAGILLLLRRPDRARWGMVPTIGIIGFGLAAFWFVPFIARLPYSNDMGWERTFAYLDNLFPFLRHDDGAAPATTAHLKVFFPLALAGVVAGLARRRRGAVALTGIALAMAIGFRFVPAGPIWNARLLPFWYLTVYFLAAVAVGELALLAHEAFARLDRPAPVDPEPALPGAGREPQPLPRRVGPGPAPVVAAIGSLVCMVLVAGVPLGVFSTGRLELPGSASIPFPKLRSTDSSFVPAWAKWNYSGYERKPDYPEFREVVSTMGEVGRTTGCGRAMWEYEPELNRFGTPMALMLLPYFTNGCIGSMEGLFFESSATVPYHFLNQSELSRTPSRAMRDLPYRDLDVRAGVEHLKLLGVRYYLAVSPQAQAQAADDPDLRLVATTSEHDVAYADGTKPRFWQVYEVRDSALVAPLEYQPAVVEQGVTTKKGWLDAAVAWYQDPSRWAVPLAPSGPKEWQRVPTATSPVQFHPVPAARVTKAHLSDDGVSFDVDRPGTPVVVRVSYFPNWKVSGARGPWRITPNLMVVIPTSTHVRLHYGWTGVDLGAWALTALALVGLVLLARRPPARLPVAPAPPAVDYVDPFVAARERREREAAAIDDDEAPREPVPATGEAPGGAH